MEASDNFYVDTARGNLTRPADDILADGGMNGVRMRLWVDPEGGTNGFEYTLALARRFQAKGQRLYLDFHFTDWWADPQKQPVPAAWPTPDEGVEALADTLRSYVNETLVAFSEAGVDFDIVSLGNEVRHGILWPLGYVDVDTDDAGLAANFTNLATLYSAAREGVNDAKATLGWSVGKGKGHGHGHGRKPPQIMIHVDNGWNLTLQQRWYGALEANGVPRSAWDLFGVSFYPFYGTSATLANLRSTLGWLAGEYGKPVHVAETDYPAICNGQYNPIPESSEPEIPYNVDGQIEWMREVVSVVREVPGGLGRGVWYWEPAWLNNTSLGSACEDAILFRPDYSAWPKTVGYSRPSTDFYLNV